MRILFQTPPVRALSSAERRPDGSDWPGTAQLVIALHEPGDANPVGASGYATFKPLSHYRRHTLLKDGVVNLSPNIRGPALAPVNVPASTFAGLPETALVWVHWRFMADKL